MANADLQPDRKPERNPWDELWILVRHFLTVIVAVATTLALTRMTTGLPDGGIQKTFIVWLDWLITVLTLSISGLGMLCRLSQTLLYGVRGAADRESERRASSLDSQRAALEILSSNKTLRKEVVASIVDEIGQDRGVLSQFMEKLTEKDQVDRLCEIIEKDRPSKLGLRERLKRAFAPTAQPVDNVALDAGTQAEVEGE